jgi:hypothetical protein
MSRVSRMVVPCNCSECDRPSIYHVKVTNAGIQGQEQFNLDAKCSLAGCDCVQDDVEMLVRMLLAVRATWDREAAGHEEAARC